MSKIFESLKRPVKFAGLHKKNPVSTSSADDSKEISAERSRHEAVQEQLADIYFGGVAKKEEPKQYADPHQPTPQKALPPPTVIKVIDRPKMQWAPWVMAVIALGFSLFAVFSTKKLSIQLSVSDTSPSTTIAKPLEIDKSMSLGETLEETKPSVDFLDVIPIPPQKFEFSGAAILNSSKNGNYLSLSNSSIASLAYASIVYSPAFDATRYTLLFEARGTEGGEQMELIFKDHLGNSSLNWKPILPFENEGLSRDWKSFSLQLLATSRFEAQAITQMRIEIGTHRTSNPSEAAILIRNLQWVPTPQRPPVINGDLQ